MTQLEYKAAISAEKARYDEAVRAINVKYVSEMNPYEIGDVIEDHIGKGHVLSCNTYIRSAWPNAAPLYKCLELKKDGTPTKRGNLRVIFWENIINRRPALNEGQS